MRDFTSNSNDGLDSTSEFEPISSRVGRFLIIHEESFLDIGLSSNVYVAESSGRYFLFDAGGHPELLSFLKTADIPADLISAVFLTHGHRDHITGLYSLLKAGITAYIAGEDKALLEEGLCATRATGGIKELAEGEVLLRALGFQALRTPGHTKGSTCFYSAGERLLISGDTVFTGGYFGRTDLDGGDSNEMTRSLTILSGLDVESMMPGHGHYAMKGARSSISAALANAKYLLKSQPRSPE